MLTVANKSLDSYMRKFVENKPTAKRGDTLPLRFITDATRINDATRLIERIKRWYLSQHGIRVQKRGDGLYLMKEEEQVVGGIHEVNKKITRTCGMAIGRIGAVDPAALDDKSRTAQEREIDYLVRQSASARDHEKRITFMLTGKITNAIGDGETK